MNRPHSDLEQALLDSDSLGHRVIDLALKVRTYLQGQQQAFEASWKREPEALQNLAQPEAQRVRRALEFYSNQLHSLEQRMQSWNEDSRQASLAGLASAAEELDRSNLLYREAVASLRGPVTHPGINSLWALIQAVPQLEAENRQYVQLQIADVCEFEISKAYMLGTSGQSDSPLLLFYGQLREVILSEEMVAAHAGQGDAQPLLDKLVALGQQYARIDVSGIARRYSHQPSPIAPINLAVQSAWLFSQGAIEESTWRALRAHAQAQLAEKLPDSHPVFPLLESLPGESSSALLQQAARLDPELFAEHSEDGEHSTFCTICGLKNVGGARKCRSCGGALAQSTTASLEGVVSSDLSSAPRLASLLHLAELMVAGEDRGQELVEGCLALSEDLAVAMQSCPDGQGYNQGAVAEAVEVAGESYLQALESLASAVDELEQFSSAPSTQVLAAVRAKFGQAAHLLTEVQGQLGPLLSSR